MFVSFGFLGRGAFCRLDADLVRSYQLIINYLISVGETKNIFMLLREILELYQVWCPGFDWGLSVRVLVRLHVVVCFSFPYLAPPPDILLHADQIAFWEFSSRC